MGQPRPRYLVPILADDGSSPPEHGRGMYTLAPSKTYYYILGGSISPFESIQITGYTAGAIVTAALIQDCNHGPAEVPDTSQAPGEWSSEKPPSGYVAADGAGWSVGTGALACVVSAQGSGVGGAMFQIGETGAARTRLSITTGANGGDFRVSGNAKD